MKTYTHRVFGEMDTKIMGDSLLLMPGERPRSADPYVEPGEPCPRCGRTDKITWTFNRASRVMTAECKCSGYYKEKFVGEVLPLTEQMKCEDRGNRKDTTCEQCNGVFSQMANKDHKLCPRCRYNAYQRDYIRKYGQNIKKGVRAKTNTGTASAD